MKINRNEKCPCGSGKKFKKCCMSKQVKSQKEIDSTMDDSDVIYNSTGEIFHPVRLHYKINDMESLKKAFGKLKCIEYDETYERFVWLYDHESKDLKLPVKVGTYPPTVLGSFFISKNKDEIFFDIRSVERTLFAVPFFDKHISRECIELTHVSLCYNYIIENTGTMSSNFDKYYPKDHAKESILQREKDLEFINKNGMIPPEKPFPNTDKINLFYYEDGISGLELISKISLSVAEKRRQGHKNITFSSIIQNVLKLKIAIKMPSSHKVRKGEMINKQNLEIVLEKLNFNKELVGELYTKHFDKPEIKAILKR